MVYCKTNLLSLHIYQYLSTVPVHTTPGFAARCKADIYCMYLVYAIAWYHVGVSYGHRPRVVEAIKEHLPRLPFELLATRTYAHLLCIRKERDFGSSFMICVCQGRQIPGLYHLHSLDPVTRGVEPYDLHDLLSSTCFLGWICIT